MPPIIDNKICIKCGQCVDVCPGDVFHNSQEGDFPKVSYPDECWHEASCVQVCPAPGAVTLRTPLPMMISYK